MMKIESMVESVMSKLLKELYMSGFDKITILKVLPIKPTMPASEKRYVMMRQCLIPHKKCDRTPKTFIYTLAFNMISQQIVKV